MPIRSKFKNSKRSAVILGASGDIGSAFVSILGKDFDQLLLTRTKHLEGFYQDKTRENWIEYAYPKKTISLEEKLLENGKSVCMFVNCVGIHARDKSTLNIDFTRKILETNFFSLQYALNKIKIHCKKDIDIINISSIASHSGSNDEFSYSASKELSDRLLASLRFDNHFKNSRILNVRPAAVQGKMTHERPKSYKFIEPLELAQFAYDTLNCGTTLKVPNLDVFRAN